MPFTQFLRDFNLFNENEISKIQNSFSPVSFEEQDIMLHEGEISDKIFFITEGILREFSYIESESTLTHLILGEDFYKLLKNEKALFLLTSTWLSYIL